MTRRGWPDLLLQLIAEVAVPAYVAEIGKEGCAGDEDTDEKNPAAAPVGKAAHLAKADGDEKGSQRGKNGQRRERIALDVGGAAHEPGGGAGGDEDKDDRDDEARTLQRAGVLVFLHAVRCAPSLRTRGSMRRDPVQNGQAVF